MPAIDLLNLSKNEIDTAKDFNLAFVGEFLMLKSSKQTLTYV